MRRPPPAPNSDITYSRPATHKGYSLIEMAVVLAVLALVAGTMLSVATTKIEYRQATAIAEKFDLLEDALLRYYQQFGHLPCPASSSEAENTATFGRGTDCNAGPPAGTTDAGVGSDAIRIGIVPTRSLGLSDTAMLDPWGNRLTYSVIKDLAINSTKFASYNTTLTNGVIQITDLNGNQIPDDTPGTVIAYTFLSHGKDGKGAANRLGTVVNACDNAAKDGENCDSDIIFRDIDIQNSTIAANYYDDIVRWKNKAWLGVVSPPPAQNPATITIAAGDLHSCALKDDGTAWCWGEGDFGRLGNGGTADQTSPVQVSGFTGGSQLSSTDEHNCALKTNGTIWCWGEGDDGRLGNGSVTDQTTPVQVSGFTNATQVTAGSHFSCALRDDATVWCWGAGTYGQIGDGDSDDEMAPVQTSVLTNVKQIDAGDQHVCALKNDGTMWCWGRGTYGKIGDGDTDNEMVPVQVSMLSAVEHIAAGEHHTCAVKNGGTVWCWGLGEMGRIGDGSGADQFTPVQVAVISGVTHVTAGYRHSCALKNDGTAWCWGYGAYGRIGDGANTDQFTPVQVNVLTTATEIVGGGEHTCALQDDGTAWCWGRGDFGRIGDGNVNHEWSPVQVLNFP